MDKASNAGTRNFNDNYNDHGKYKKDNDIKSLLTQKENAEKEAKYFKEHYHKLKNDMDELLKMTNESSQNKKDLKDIIEQKNKAINELKRTTNSEALKEEILHATEKLAQEKKKSSKLQSKLNEISDNLSNCQREKFQLTKKLEQFQIDFRKYDKLQEKLTSMIEKQGALEELFKRNEEALNKSNSQRDAFQHELFEAKQFIQMELLKKKSAKIYQHVNCDPLEKEFETVQRELKIGLHKNGNEDLHEQKQLKNTLENELRQKLIIDNRTKLNKDVVESVSNPSKNLKHSQEQTKISELNNLIDNYKSENSKLGNDVAELNKRVLNIESISTELRHKLEEKECCLGEKIREIEILKEKICSLSKNDKIWEQSVRCSLQEEFSEKMRIIKEYSEEKEKNLIEQLNDTKMELHESVRKQNTIIAENSAQVMSLESKITMQEQEIIKVESEKFALQENIKNLSVNKKSFDSNLETIKKQLEKVTQERDEKTKVILSLRKMSQQMQSFADESRDEKERIYMENDSLRQKAYDAQSRLEEIISEQESHKNEIEILQQKLVELDRNYSLEKVKLKKIEAQLKQELAETQTQFTATTTEKNKIFYEKEMTLKNLKECEKCLANAYNELGIRNSEIKKLQREQDELHSKILEYRDKITHFETETDKLLQEKENFRQRFLMSEKSVEKLEEEVMEKSDTITELSYSYEILKVKNTELQHIENEFEELRIMKNLLSKQNSELKEKCDLLDDDLDTLQNELKIGQKSIEELQKKNESLEASLQKSNEDNFLLKTAAEEFGKLEKGNDALSNKCNSLSVSCNKLDVELGVVRKELIQSREKQSKLEEEVKTLKNSEIDWRQKCSSLAVKNNNLFQELSQGNEERVKLVEEIEILRNKEKSKTSENERLYNENIKVNKLMLEKTLNFDELQTRNAELIKKCCNFDSKELFYEEEIRKKTEELTLNVAEHTRLRGKFDVLGPKLAKYVSQYKILKQKNTELQDIIDKANEASTNNQKENTRLKKYYQNIEIELSKLKSENEKLSEEVNQKESQPERFQNKQEGPHQLQAGIKSTPKIKLLNSEDDPVYHLDTLAGQVRQSNSPAAKHLLKSCKHIKDLIIKEREDRC